MNKNRKQIMRLVSMAMLTALVIALQYFASFIKLGPYSPALVLVPITIGAMLYGSAAGAYLGFIFSLVVLLTPGQCEYFYSISVIGTIITVVAKGTLAGLFAGLSFHALKKKNFILAVFIASIIGPLTNSLLFRVGVITFFYEMVSTGASEQSTSTFVYLFLFLTGPNFFIELGLNVLLAPAMARICDIIADKLKLDAFAFKKDKNPGYKRIKEKNENI